MQDVPIPSALTSERLSYLLAVTTSVETPALIFDEVQLQANLEAGAALTKAYGLRCRPHAKTHKSVEIAKRQVALGAVGICCQKVSEAEIFATGGINNILITNEIVAPSKIRRLAGLAATCRIAVCVDRADTLVLLSESMMATKALLDVYVELDIGQLRCGLPDPVDCANLAAKVASTSFLRFAGIQAFDGGAQHIEGSTERANSVSRASSKLKCLRKLLSERGLSDFVITGGGTGTIHEEGRTSGLDEIQIGSYVFLDGQYARNRGFAEQSRFGHALFVVAQVISTSRSRLVLDAGVKSINFDGGATTLAGMKVRLLSSSDEHTVFEMHDGESAPPVGTRVLVLPSHCDPTVNLHRNFVVATEARCTTWPVDAQGTIQ